MAVRRNFQGLLGWLVLAICVSGLRGDCGPYEEGQPVVYTCVSPGSTDIQMHLYDINGTREVPVYCHTSCIIYDPAVTATVPVSGTVIINITDADRNLVAIDCYDLKRQVVVDTCNPSFYVDPVPTQPCTDIAFSEDFTMAEVTCIYDVYPNGTCEYGSWNGSDISGLGGLEMNGTWVSKADRVIAPNLLYTCHLLINLEDSEPGEYGLQVIMNVTDGDPYMSQLPQFNLIALSLLSEDNLEHEYPTGGYLELAFTIRGFPPPLDLDLAIRNNVTGVFDIHLKEDEFSTTYSEIDSATGKLTAKVFGGFSADKKVEFQLEASNGLQGESLKIHFYVTELTATSSPDQDDDDENHDDDHDDDHTHEHGCHHHGDAHHGHDDGSHVHPPPVPYGYYPGVGYAPYYVPHQGYGPWAGYVNPRFGGMVYGQYPPFMDMGWYPYRGWFPWG